MFYYFYFSFVETILLKDIYIRTITGALFLVAVIGSILVHPLAFFSLMLIFSVLGLNEFFILSGTNNGRKNNLMYYLLGTIFYVVIGLTGLGYLDISFVFLLILVFPLSIINELFRKSHASWLRVGTYFTGFLYISLPFGLMNALYFSPGLEQPSSAILIGLFVIVWSNDVFAYLVGSMFGKHRLFERVSPKKSWEGSIGGLVFALFASWILSVFYHQMDVWHWLGIAVIIAITGTLGDLSASLLKRIAGVKDTGNLLPGHGGVIDRFDAVLFAAPFVFVYLNFL